VASGTGRAAERTHLGRNRKSFQVRGRSRELNIDGGEKRQQWHRLP
jgi:hypothetical protein